MIEKDDWESIHEKQEDFYASSHNTATRGQVVQNQGGVNNRNNRKLAKPRWHLQWETFS